MKYDIITIGSASRDVFLNSPDFKIVNNGEGATGQTINLPLGSKLEVKKIIFATGGSGTNTAVTFARPYIRTIATVNYLASVLSWLMARLYGKESSQVKPEDNLGRNNDQRGL